MFFGGMRTIRSRSATFKYDPDALAYFAAGGITNTTEKLAANAFIVGCKADGTWTSFSRVYLRSPTSLSAALLCCKTLISQTAVNSPTHSSSGLAFNGTTQYCRTGDTLVSAMSEITTTSGHISVYCNQADGQQTTLAGCEKDNNPTADDSFYLRNGIAV
jgi:hypothetical protein